MACKWLYVVTKPLPCSISTRLPPPQMCQPTALTDNDSGVAAIVQRSRAAGVVQGTRDGGCQMNYLRRDVDVKAGDRVVTSGLDGIFPKGIMIGEIVDLALEHRDLLLSARVEPSVRLAELEEVLVVEPAVELEVPGELPPAPADDGEDQ